MDIVNRLVMTLLAWKNRVVQ